MGALASVRLYERFLSPKYDNFAYQHTHQNENDFFSIIDIVMQLAYTAKRKISGWSYATVILFEFCKASYRFRFDVNPQLQFRYYTKPFMPLHINNGTSFTNVTINLRISGPIVLSMRPNFLLQKIGVLTDQPSWFWKYISNKSQC